MLAIVAFLSDIFYFIQKFFKDILAKITGKEETETEPAA